METTMRNIIKKCISLLAAPLLLASAFQYATAQRIFDEFDAPQVVSNKLYIDYGIAPNSLSTYYLAPYRVDLPYQEVTGGNVVVFNGDNDEGDYSLTVNGNDPNAQVPFYIDYAGNTINSIQITTNGYVSLNSSSAVSKDPTELFKGDNNTMIVAPFWGDHNVAAGGEVTWKVWGSAPKRRLTIQWKNIQVNTKKDGNDGRRIGSFQVTFYERYVPGDVSFTLPAYNKHSDFEFAYGAFSGLATDAVGAAVGINDDEKAKWVNGLSWSDQSTATTSKDLSTVWPVSGTSLKTIRFEAYQKSIPINPNDFFSRFLIGSDRDDGYYAIDMDRFNFDFTFGGVRQNNMWICVNGYTTFSNPQIFSHIVNDNPQGLFLNSSSYPFNVIAPFWGNHIYRFGNEPTVPSANGFYMNSEISYVVVGSYPNRRLVVQWKNLNVMDRNLPNSVANFQAIFYEGVDERYPNNYAGAIEFAYGDVGNNTRTTAREVNVKGASVGLKGNLGTMNPAVNSDFLNGLTYNAPQTSRTSTVLTDGWRPSGGSSSSEGRRILFSGIPRFVVPTWGDGDADLTQLRTRKHAGLPQNRFVTVNDARLVMRWLVNDGKLPDSLRMDTLQFGNAYHADVNHNGRYYYSSRSWDNQTDVRTWKRPIDMDTFGIRILWDSVETLTTLPPDAGPLRLIYYEATALDAALILHYNAGRVPSLPWMWDTIPSYGKVVAGKSTSPIAFGTPVVTNDGAKIVPVYATAKTNKAFAFSVTFNGKVMSSEVGANSTNDLIINDAKTVHFAASEITNTKEPIAFIKIDSDNELVAEKIIVNDVVLGKENIEQQTGVTGSIASYPNPFDQEVTVSVPSEFKGGVLTVSDVNGRVIGTFSLNQETMTLNAFAGKPAGVYTITMKNGVKTANSVIIKQ
jgi:hypothetical protein